MVSEDSHHLHYVGVGHHLHLLVVKVGIQFVYFIGNMDLVPIDVVSGY